MKDRLYRVRRYTPTAEKHTQFLEPKAHWELIFQAAHYNLISGHRGYEKTLDQVKGQLYWPGIPGDGCQRCASSLDSS